MTCHLIWTLPPLLPALLLLQEQAHTFNTQRSEQERRACCCEQDNAQIRIAVHCYDCECSQDMRRQLAVVTTVITVIGVSPTRWPPAMAGMVMRDLQLTWH
jgi:hypothetical protein